MIAIPMLFRAILVVAAPGLEARTPFAIQVVDQQTGRGVPLVELSTVNNIRLYTDSNGIAAFNEPGLMNQKVFFHIKSHGYEFPKDGFGFRGKALDVTPGGRARLEIKRINIAERLYRVTGAGIYRGSLLVGQPVPIHQPLLNAQVFGSDSVVNTVYKGKIYWFWGDTNRPSYPLGNFHVPGATSLLPADGGLDPEAGVDLEYFLDEHGFAKETARMPGEGPTWIGALITLEDKTGRERMFANYVKVKQPMVVYQRGQVEFNDQEQQFEKRVQFDTDWPIFPTDHPLKYVHDGVEYVYFPTSFVRVRATPEDLGDLTKYEAFTCLKKGSREESPELDRTEDGTLRYCWKTGTPPLGPNLQAQLIQAGRLDPQEVWLQLQDVQTGKPVKLHRGSVYWNQYRRRWVMIALEIGGTSLLGEIWYAEGDTPLGPWVYAKKIVTHDKYSFYNPKQHPMLDKHGGRIIFFEGSYTNMFSGNPDQTPRYNYNQIMYKLDLADPRLNLPVAVYECSDTGIPDSFGTRCEHDSGLLDRPIAFWALERPGPDTVPVYEAQTERGTPMLQVGDPPQQADNHAAKPLFHVLPAQAKSPSATTVPLFEFRHEDGVQRAYATEDRFPALDGYRRWAKPIALVWRHPIRRTLVLDE